MGQQSKWPLPWLAQCQTEARDLALAPAPPWPWLGSGLAWPAAVGLSLACGSERRFLLWTQEAFQPGCFAMFVLKAQCVCVCVGKRDTVQKKKKSLFSTIHIQSAVHSMRLLCQLVSLAFTTD